MEISGTYRLISSSRQILDTCEEVAAFGKNAKGASSCMATIRYRLSFASETK
jgi:hypothetical protein